MNRVKQIRTVDQQKWLFIPFLVILIVFANRVNGFELELSGKWECEQREIISDSMTGENKYTLVYSYDSSLVNQSGSIRIIDVTRSLESSIKYELRFEFSNDGSIFKNTLKHLETRDQGVRFFENAFKVRSGFLFRYGEEILVSKNLTPWCRNG